MDSKIKPASNPERWVSLYPSFINSKKSLAEGRRIPKEKAVDNPTSSEICDVLSSQGLNVRIEKKMYPRDANRDMNFQGRVRIQLKGENDEFLNEKFQSRKSLMFFAAEMIPKLKSRLQRTAGLAQSDQSATQSQKRGNKNKKGK